MATIKPFRAIQPNPFYADQLVFPGDEQVFFLGKHLKQYPLQPLKEQLEAPARLRPETEEGQQQAYRKIKENLLELLNLDRLRKEEKPGFYIYEIVHRNYRQTGIWALTDVRDFTEGKIKLHEFTFPDSERRIANYRKHTGLEGSPVLLTYQPTVEINRIIAETCACNKRTTIGNKKSMHRIWKIEDEETLNQLMAAFAKVNNVYMADGHHRLAGAVKPEGSAFISSLYIATDQLRILDYHRVIIPEDQVDEDLLLAALEKNFTIFLTKEPAITGHPHVLGMYVNRQWYELIAKEKTKPDVLLLQEDILAPVFHIDDPRSDLRLKCIGGENARQETMAFVKRNKGAIAFALCPMTVKDLISAADKGTILPPKSTWIDPKVPYGLLINQDELT